jgi:exopolysaccharide production protein ExoQ
MPPQTAALVFVVGIIGLFFLDHDREVRASTALCVPFVYLWTATSRSLEDWLAILQTGHPPAAVDQATMYANGSPLDRAVLSGLMVLAVVILIRRGRLGVLLRANLPIILFLVYGAVSVFWSDFPEITIRRWFKSVGCLLMVMVVLSERDRDAAMKRLFVWAGFLLIPLSILFIKYYPAIGRVYVIENISTWVQSPVGATDHKNSLGAMCQVYGLIFVWHFIAAYRDRQRPHRIRHLIAHGVALAMVAWLFAQANSVTAQSSFLLGTLFLIATSTRNIARKPRLVHLLMAALVAVPFAILFLGIGGGAIEAMGRNSTLTGRTEIWALVLKLVPNPVVGTGFESFWLGSRLEAMQRHMRGLNEAHNGFIEVYISMGWIGVLLLLVMIVIGYRNMIICFRRNPDAGRLRLALFLTVIVSSFTEAAFRAIGVSWIIFLLTTMATREGSLHRSVPSTQVIGGTSRQQLDETIPVGTARLSPILE